MRLPTEYELVASVRSLLCDHLAIAAAVELSQFTSHAPDGDLRFICLAIAAHFADLQRTHQLAYSLCAAISPRIATPSDQLNRHLAGGLHPRQIYHFYSAEGDGQSVGRTGLFQFVTALAANTVLPIRHGGCRAKVLYLATDPAIKIGQVRAAICHPQYARFFQGHRPTQSRTTTGRTLVAHRSRYSGSNY